MLIVTYLSTVSLTSSLPQGDSHPIVPVMLGDARLASEFADEMLEKGIYVIGFSYPVVPKGYLIKGLVGWWLKRLIFLRSGTH